MRKVSKSRTDDDGMSSANGSVINDDHSDTQQSDQNDQLSDSDAEPSREKSEEKEAGKKGKSGKSKGKKRKSEKEDNDVEEEYEVDKVIDSKKIKGKLHYLIRWKGYSADSDTWEPENTLSCPELINKYHEEKGSPTKKRDSSPKKGKKRGAKKEKAGPKKAKRPKTEWDSENADENAEYEVERILEVHHGKNGKREFLIHWKGWSNKFDSWEPENNLNCTDLINKFMEKVEKAKSTDSRSLRVAPGTTNRFTLQAPSSGRRLSKRRGQKQRVRYDDAE